MNNSLATAVVFLLGAAFGSVGAYYFARDKFAKLAEEEIASVKELYKKQVVEDFQKSIAEEDDAPDPTTVNDYAKLIDTNGYVPKNSIDFDALKVDKEIAEQPTYAVPSLITEEEFMHGGGGAYTKQTVMYYLEDDVLADDNDQPMDDISGTVGDDALLALTGKVFTTYVRNERLSTDYEVCRVNGSYSEIVLGIKPEKPRIRRMRQEDDD